MTKTSYDELIISDFSTQQYLTIAEAGICLKLSQNSVRRLIQKGKIAAFRAFGSAAIRVDVEKTKAILEESLNLNDVEEKGVE